MGSLTKSRPRFRTGDWVSFLYGTRRLLVQVIEDRGPIGAARTSPLRSQTRQ